MGEKEEDINWDAFNPDIIPSRIFGHNHIVTLSEEEEKAFNLALLKCYGTWRGDVNRALRSAVIEWSRRILTQ